MEPIIFLIAGYCALIFIGSKFFHLKSGLSTTWANLIIATILFGYTLFAGKLQDSLLLLIAFGVIIIGSIIRIVMDKKKTEQ